ncbi:MAG: hypothetical protein ACJA1A_002903 [Saprospiraceae bacterium]|jgi:hypothetical protein
MKSAQRYTTFLVLCLFTWSLSAQQAPVEFTTSTTKIHKLGKTKPVAELIKKSMTSSEKKRAYKLRKKAPDNFKGRGKSKVSVPAIEHQGPDEVLQFEMGSRPANVPIVNIDGLFSSFGSPHDPTGDIGTTHYMQAINGTEIGVFTKNGEQVTNFSANNLWSEFNISGRGDPIILFDEMSKRWIITEFANPADVLIAISDSEDPLGSYNAYNFSTPNFPDYPKYAVWPNALVFTSNEGGAGNLHNYFIDRAALLAGEDDVTMQRIQIAGSFATQAGFFVSTPLDFNGDTMPLETRPMVMKLNDSSWGNAPEDRIELFNFDIDWENQANTMVTRTDIVTTPFDSYPCSESGSGFQCVPQLNGGGLDAIPEVIMNVPQYRNFGTHQSIVLSFVTDATVGQNQSAIRWVELRKSGMEDYSIYQEGTYAPDGLDRYMSSIAIDKFGNIGLGYNVSSPDMYVGLRYTGRFVDDPLGEMTFEEVNVVDGLGAIVSGGRFGDYAQMGVDPNDGVTFWYTSEYAHTTRSRTRLVAFQLQKNAFDAAPIEVTNPITGPNLGVEEFVSVTVSNVGLEDLENVVVGLLYQGVTLSTFTIPEVLSENETYNHTFDVPIDMAAYETFEIKTFTSFEADDNFRNDTLITMISRVAVIDGELSGANNLETCDDNRPVNIRVTNAGVTDLTEVNFEITTNGLISGTDIYTGNIAIGESKLVPVRLSGLIEGSNDVTISITSVNGEDDINESNNTTNLTVSFIDERFEYTLLLTTDTYPEETSWTVTSSAGDVVAQGGGYASNNTLFTEHFCLEDGECYTFRMFDAGGDGICCGFGNGSYQVMDAAGNSIIVSDGLFNSQQLSEICAGTPCSLGVEVSTTNVSIEGQADGSILITANGGVEPYSYSINGGDTYQSSPLFEGLAAGNYDISVITADEGCDFTVIAVVEISTSVIDIDGSYSINVSPNPSDGFYHVSLSNFISAGYSMKMQVVDVSGRVIQEMPLQKYNNVFEGDLSLIDYPKGIYYLRFLDKSIKHMARLVKI